jgi:hypothetical protein
MPHSLARKLKFVARNQPSSSVKIGTPKYSACNFPKISNHRDILLRHEGRIADVTTREAEMRWTLMCLLTSGMEADGEIVWS